MCFSRGLIGLMMLDNDKKRGVSALAVTLVSDVVFDLLNVFVFEGGMLGMAVATSLSNLLGMLVVMTHFLRKNRILHFTPRNPDFREIKEVVLCGIPNALSLGSQAIVGIIFNAFLLTIGSGTAVAALSVANSAFSVVTAVSLGVFSSTSTICSLLYGEEDRDGLFQAFKLSSRIALTGFSVIALILILSARPIAGLFLDSTALGELDQSARFIRMKAVSILLAALSFSVSGAYQGVRRLWLNYTIDGLREGVLPILCALVMGSLFGLTGFEWSFAASGAILLLFLPLVPAVKNRRFSLSARDLLLLPEDFGSAPGNMFTVSLNTMEEVMNASLRINEFCRQRGLNRRLSMLTSLFVEEMAGNTVTHGFEENKAGHLDLRIVIRPDRLVIRLRDDGVPFDPVKWLERNNPTDPASGIGIRIMVGLAADVRYIPAMGLNNLMIIV